MSVEERLAALGLALPSPPVPVGNYIPAARTGDLVFTSGQTSRIDGVRRYVGMVGRDVTPDDAYRSARDATLNCLACVKTIVGDLERIARVIRVVGFVRCPPAYERLSEVLDGASDLLVNVLGDRGRHARTIIAGGGLPSNASVEVELVVEVRP
jgi:enamine deaminase RidA (YjgF/YER057c/UK114 family)